MNKEKQPLLYTYSTLIPDENFSAYENFAVTEKFKEKFDNSPNYKFLYTWRAAFVGDMQQEIDKAAGRNQILHYANTTSCNREFKIEKSLSDHLLNKDEHLPFRLKLLKWLKNIFKPNKNNLKEEDITRWWNETLTQNKQY